MASETALIGIDWGTTSARAYRVAGDGTVIDSRAAPLGVQAVPDGDFARALDKLLGPWSSIAVPRLACGMIGSRQGWVEAPYVDCPASRAELAACIVEVPGANLGVVPGVTTRDRDRVPDVMRGEETQLAGAIGPDVPAVLAVLPGTHSKWARVEQGRIVDFATFMTGELFAVLLEHSILGRLARAAPLTIEPTAAFDRGLARGLEPGSLAHDAFGARTLALTGELAAADVGEWLSGLLIGREIHDARGWAAFGMMPVCVIGNDALSARYAHALGFAGIAADRAPPDAAARGLWSIARVAGLLQ